MKKIGSVIRICHCSLRIFLRRFGVAAFVMRLKHVLVDLQGLFQNIGGCRALVARQKFSTDEFCGLQVGFCRVG